MRLTTSLSLIAALCIVGCSSSSAVRTASRSSNASVAYTVSVPDPASEMFHVEAMIRGVDDDTLTFLMPVWAPGAYDIVDFGKYVRDFEAHSFSEAGGYKVGTKLNTVRVDSNTFKITGRREGPVVRLTYNVQDIEYVPNSAWFGLSDVEGDMAFANTTALFGYPSGYKDVPYTVTFNTPKGWDLAIGLDRASEAQANTFVARDYDELVDSPVQMGKFQRFDFDVRGIPHLITISAPQVIADTIGAKLVDVTRRIIDVMSGLYGDMPYKRYIFHHFLVPPRNARGGFGALEHANASAYRMPFYSQESVPGSLAAVVAHEYWHLWNPKRIHVHELGPFNYQKAPETTSLWFAEGLTEYYARALLSRIGYSRPQSYLGDVLSDMTGLYRREQHEPMTELSRRIAKAPTSELVDLYKKGPLLGLLLDVEIRWQTKNERSLDDAMRYFNDEFGKKGKTFGDEDIIPIMERATGAKLGEFYSRYIAGRDTMPFDEAFKHAGLMYVVRDTMRPGLGVITQTSSKGARVTHVLANSSASAMGLKVDDVLVTMDYDGYGVSFAAVPSQMVDQWFADLDDEATMSSGEPRYNIRSLTITRDGMSMNIPAAVHVSPSTIERLDVDPNAAGLALEIRKSMLGF